jgi:hypothetical protein
LAEANQTITAQAQRIDEPVSYIRTVSIENAQLSTTKALLAEAEKRLQTQEDQAMVGKQEAEFHRVLTDIRTIATFEMKRIHADIMNTCRGYELKPDDHHKGIMAGQFGELNVDFHKVIRSANSLFRDVEFKYNDAKLEQDRLRELRELKDGNSPQFAELKLLWQDTAWDNGCALGNLEG